MKLIEYFNNQFPTDLAKLKTDPLTGPMLFTESYENYGLTENSRLFGGSNWKENLQSDLKDIESQNIKPFILSLFSIVLIDQAMYSYFKQFHDPLNTKIFIPKFAGNGMSPDFLNPRKIISIALSLNIFSKEELESIQKDYFSFLVELCDQLFGNEKKPKTKEFLKALIEDADFKSRRIEDDNFSKKIIENIQSYTS